MAKRIAGALFMLLMMTLVCNSPVLANGGKAKAFHLTGHLDGAGDGFWTFVAQGNSVTFYLTTLNNKYYVLVIRAESRAKVPLKLSKDDDAVEISFGSRTITGILNLPTVDRQTWDGLSDKMRAKIVYPLSIPAGEEEGIYVCLPIGDLKSQKESFAIPDFITYTVKSIDKQVMLHRPMAKK